jgi:hypothetical protein
MKALHREVKSKQPSGRPRKFSGISRPVTITLPERTLKLLESVDGDRALAIVKAVDIAVGPNDSKHEPVRLVKVDKHSSLIVVGPSRTLRQIPWLNLVEITTAQFIIVLPTGTAPERLELEILDILSILPSEDAYERALLEGLQRRISAMRKTKGLGTSEIVLLRSQDR